MVKPQIPQHIFRDSG